MVWPDTTLCHFPRSPISLWSSTGAHSFFWWSPSTGSFDRSTFATPNFGSTRPIPWRHRCHTDPLVEPNSDCHPVHSKLLSIDNPWRHECQVGQSHKWIGLVTPGRGWKRNRTSCPCIPSWKLVVGTKHFLRISLRRCHDMDFTQWTTFTPRFHVHSHFLERIPSSILR